MARLTTTTVLLLLSSPFFIPSMSASHHNRPPFPSLRRGPRIPAAQVPLCGQEQLVAVANTLTHLREKQLCQTAIYEKEMLKSHDPAVLCYNPSCVDALQTMYRTLPKCRFRDWNVQFHAEMLLRDCGIQPRGTHDEDSDRPLSMASCSPEPATEVTPEMAEYDEMNSPMQNQISDDNRAYWLNSDQAQ
ncbi:hypothetical protein Gpo141_00000157 [Globisporangium polare]